eukprot:EG_transcript_45798
MPLFLAAEAGDLEAVRRLGLARLKTMVCIACIPRFSDSGNPAGRPSLYAARAKGLLAPARHCWSEAAAAVDETDRGSCTPLFAAAQNGHTAVVGWLLSAA